MSINRKIKFLDSLSYFHMRLSALPKAFGFDDQNSKGWYPHLFNKSENQDYSSPMLSRELYAPENMDNADRVKFEEWYLEALNSNYIFNFASEISKDCLDYVNILRKACSAVRKTFIEVGETYPFTEASTIARACSELYRKNFLKDNVIGIMPSGGYRKTNNYSGVSLEWLLVVEKET